MTVDNIQVVPKLFKPVRRSPGISVKKARTVLRETAVGYACNVSTTDLIANRNARRAIAIKHGAVERD